MAFSVSGCIVRLFGFDPVDLNWIYIAPLGDIHNLLIQYQQPVKMGEMHFFPLCSVIVLSLYRDSKVV